MTAAFELFEASGWVLLGCACFLSTWGLRRIAELPAPSPWLRRVGTLLGLALVATGVWLRVSGLREFEARMLTSDENWQGVIYVSDFVHRLETYRSFGASHGTFAYGIDAWNRLFGFDPVGTRWFSVTSGLAALALFYLGLRGLTTASLALLSAGLLSVSPFVVFFSRIATEHSHTLFYASACLLACSCWRRRPGAARAFPIGLLAGLGYFVYAGFPVALAALALGCGGAWLISRPGRRLVKGVQSARPSPAVMSSALAAALGFAAIYVPMILLHTRVFGGRFLSTGGGRLTLSMASVREAWTQLVRDLFVGGTSWYLPFRDLPVLERTLLPFAALGAVWAWRRHPSTLARGCLLAAPLLIALCTPSGQYPGMRRALVVLAPYAFCAAAGVLLVLGRLADLRSRPAGTRSTRALRHVGTLVGVTLVGLCCFHAVA